MEKYSHKLFFISELLRFLDGSDPPHAAAVKIPDKMLPLYASGMCGMCVTTMRERSLSFLIRVSNLRITNNTTHRGTKTNWINRDYRNN